MLCMRLWVYHDLIILWVYLIIITTMSMIWFGLQRRKDSSLLRGIKLTDVHGQAEPLFKSRATCMRSGRWKSRSNTIGLQRSGNSMLFLRFQSFSWSFWEENPSPKLPFMIIHGMSCSSFGTTLVVCWLQQTPLVTWEVLFGLVASHSGFLVWHSGNQIFFCFGTKVKQTLKSTKGFRWFWKLVLQEKRWPQLLVSWGTKLCHYFLCPNLVSHAPNILSTTRCVASSRPIWELRPANCHSNWWIYGHKCRIMQTYFFSVWSSMQQLLPSGSLT